jgi:Na+/proline symporter
MVEIGRNAGRLEIFHWTPVVKTGEPAWQAWLKDANIFWLAFLNAFVTTFAAFGADQLMTQRMLTCKDARLSRRSLILSGFIGIPVMAVFLLIGVAIYAYYQIYPDPNLPTILVNGKPQINSEKVFSHFIIHVLPTGLKGLLIIGILSAAMSSLDSALGALSSSFVVDIYRPLICKDASESHYLWVSRINVVMFGIILAGIAFLFRNTEGFLWLCFKVVSITYGSLLGIFLLGVTTTRGNNTSNLIAMTSSAVINIVLLILIEEKIIGLAWSLLIVLGTVCTYLVAYVGGTQRGKF